MWCLETIKQINTEAAKGKNAYESYTAASIRILGNTSRQKERNTDEKRNPKPHQN
jgi:hypothetical protein